MLVTQNDRQRITTGLQSFWRHFRTADHISLSLARFSAASAVAREGGRNTYECLVANNTGEHRWVKLLIDIYLKDRQVHPEGHYAYFTKSIYVRSKDCEHVRVTYDWNDRAAFCLDGLEFPADDLWRGSCREEKHYMIKASLLNEDGIEYEGLQLIQNLSV